MQVPYLEGDARKTRGKEKRKEPMKIMFKCRLLLWATEQCQSA
jgi:hypothetical protein